MRHFSGLEFSAPENSQNAPNRQNELLHYSDRMALGRKTEKTPMSEKGELAAEAIDRWGDFQEGLASVKRNIPSVSFKRFGPQQNAMPN